MKIIWEQGDCPQDRVFFSRVAHARNPSDLRWSHYRVDPETGAVTHKTCPRCSQRAGQFIWHRMESFGFRVMEDNQILPQAQCYTCRGRYRRELRLLQPLRQARRTEAPVRAVA
jgi:hypothetical protein